MKYELVIKIEHFHYVTYLKLLYVCSQDRKQS